MELSPKDRILDLAIFLYGVWEISSTRFVQQILKPGMTFIDVGANSGYYSLLAAGLVGPQGHVHAFEPVAGPFERLRRNLELNRLHNVTIARAAVASEPGDAIVYPSAVKNNDGLGSLEPGPEREVTGDLVPKVSIDHMFGALRMKRVDFIKVDVEGGESQVFDGAHHVLGSPEAPALLFESFDVRPMVESMAIFGYEVRHVHYSLDKGLEFPRVGEVFDNHSSGYDAPNYCAIKVPGRWGTFDEISRGSKYRLRTPLRILAALA